MSPPGSVKRVIILGAAGRDFHNYNVVYRDDPQVVVTAFTAAQIPGIANRRYPPSLAGKCYPAGIPIVPESELEALCRNGQVDEVVFAYSDVPHAEVMHLASRALACGADYTLLGPQRTMLRARVPVVAVSAVRTGCGKTQTARYLSQRLRAAGLTCAVLRHPMPYGELEGARVQRLASRDDLARAHCTIEEREEYEPHIDAGNVVYAGIDYVGIVRLAEREAQLILWDGGNNDFPFVRPDVHVVLVDPLRSGDETTYHPGEAVLRMADIVVIAKTNAAQPRDVERLAQVVSVMNRGAALVHGASVVKLDAPALVHGRRALVVEDGPTLTHGGMSHGAGYAAALAAHAEIVDPHPYAAPAMAATLVQYPHIGPVLPALGYSASEVAALRETIVRTPAEVVVTGTPVDLGALLDLDRPVVRARYDYADAGSPDLWTLVDQRLRRLTAWP